MSLSVPQTAVDGLIQVFSLPGFRIACSVHAYESYTGAPYNLTNFSCHRNTSADARHTSGTRKTAIELFRLNLGVWSLIGVQSVSAASKGLRLSCSTVPIGKGTQTVLHRLASLLSLLAPGRPLFISTNSGTYKAEDAS